MQFLSPQWTPLPEREFYYWNQWYITCWENSVCQQKASGTWDFIARLPLELTELTVTKNRLNLNRPNRYDPQDKILISVVKCHVQVWEYVRPRNCVLVWMFLVLDVLVCSYCVPDYVELDFILKRFVDLNLWFGPLRGTNSRSYTVQHRPSRGNGRKTNCEKSPLFVH